MISGKLRSEFPVVTMDLVLSN